MAPQGTAIVGAGIAGLTAALLLSRSGRQVSVFERMAVPYEVGAGLQLSPNAGRILEQLGLGAALDAVSVRPLAIDVYSGQNARPIVTMPLAGAAVRHGAAYRVLHRADLQAILLEAVGADPTIELAFSSPIADIEAADAGIGFSVGPARLAADLLVGADGIRSAVRRWIEPTLDAMPEGRTAWRTTLKAEDAPDGLPLDRVSVFLSDRSHVVVYPVRAGREVNIVAIVEEAWLGDNWAEPGDRHEIAGRFRNAPAPLAAAIAAATSWTRWCLRAVEPSGSWQRGHAVLVGDAAHAMLPFLAQGAAMAIEDAAILTRCLAQPGSGTEAALRRYEALRKPRVIRVWRTARQNGAIYHMSPLAAPFRDATMKGLGGERLLARYDWLYGWKQNG